MTTKEVAEALGVAQPTVTLWVRKGKLEPAYRGAIFLFHRSTVEAVPMRPRP